MAAGWLLTGRLCKARAGILANGGMGQSFVNQRLRAGVGRLAVWIPSDRRGALSGFISI